MSLKTEIIPYIDGEGYVAPSLVTPGMLRSSDNQTLYSSELYIMLAKLQQETSLDIEQWQTLISRCMPVPGLTVRSPGDTAIDAPDNMYGIAAASKVLDVPIVADEIIRYGIDHWGFYNATGSFTWSAFQFRQPQLLYALMGGAGRIEWWKIWQLPLAIYSALVILTSCINTPKSDSTSRILAWLLIQATSDSFLCRLASKVWLRRLRSVYGDTEMLAVAQTFFPAGHPLAKYWVTE